MIFFGTNFLNIRSIDQYRTVVYFIQPHDQIDQRRFSCAGSPDDTDHFSRFHRQIYLFQNRLIRFISKRRMGKCDFSLHLKIFWLCIVFDKRILCQNIIDSFNTADQIHEITRHRGHPVEILIQKLRIGNKLQQFSGCHRTAKHIAAAKINDQKNPRTKDKIDHRHKQCPKHFIFLLHPAEFICQPVKFFLFFCFFSIGFYDPHSGDHILKITIDIIALFPLQVKTAVNIFPPGIGNENHNRNKNKGQ